MSYNYRQVASFVSSDFGETWKGPYAIIPPPLASDQNDFARVTFATGKFIVTWESNSRFNSTILGNSAVSAAVSHSNDGKIWSSPVMVNIPDSLTEPLREEWDPIPFAIENGSGGADYFVMFQRHEIGDMVYCRSTDLITWSFPIPLVYLPPNKANYTSASSHGYNFLPDVAVDGNHP